VLRRIALSALLALLLAPAAHAAPRMWIGFQDDPRFRWTADREENLDSAQEAGATVIRTTVYWSRIATRRPARAADPFDPVYNFDDLDEMVRGAQLRGMEVLLTIWGTPRWAGPAQNRLPRRLSDLTNFSRAVAARYSGRYAGYPFVRFYTVWNEPNREIFLAPQYASNGKPVAPANYAKLFRAGYAGIKAGNRQALVAAGVTASNGRDRRLGRRGVQETMSPGKFAELVSKARPRIRFDAWAHHPYPTRPSLKPTQKVRWPNVSLASMPRLGTSLDKWFKRKNVPIWITEYGHETRPEDRRGVSYATQRAYAIQALGIARRNPRVQMFIWFILKDHVTTPWDSGLVRQTSARKPAFGAFASVARGMDARNAILTVRTRNPLVRVSALPIAYYSPRGAPIGVLWELYRGGVLLGRGLPSVPLLVDGSVVFAPEFTPARRATYVLRLRLTDEHGNVVLRTLTLLGA
jgi:hypothetical protein